MTAPIITKAEWLERRSKRLSASNWAKAAFTPFSLWAQMTGRCESTVDPDAHHIKAGNRFEDGILDLGSEEEKVELLDFCAPEERARFESISLAYGGGVEAWVYEKVKRMERYQPLVVSGCGRYSATLDGVVYDSERGDWGVAEAKLRNAKLGKMLHAEDDEFPIDIWMQVGAQLFVSGLDFGIVMAVSGFSEIITRRFAHESFPMESIEATGKRFLGWLERDEAPPATGDDLDALKAAYPVREAKEISLGEDIAGLVMERDELRQAAKKLEAEANDKQAKILQAIGDAQRAKLPNGWTIRRSVVTVPAQMRAAYSYTNCTVTGKGKKS